MASFHILANSFFAEQIAQGFLVLGALLALLSNRALRRRQTDAQARATTRFSAHLEFRFLFL